METIIENGIKSSVSGAFSSATTGDASGQPWYWRWGVSALGVLGGVLLAFSAIASILHPVDMLLKIGFASVLLSFEATGLAKGFNFAACQTLIGFAEKLAPLMRTVIYALCSVAVIIVCDGVIGNVLICIPALVCAALYFLLYLDQRGGSSDQEPVMEEPVNEFA